MDPVVVTLTVLAMLVALGGLVAISLGRDKTLPRGQEPGKGRFVREIDYQSGLGGGQVARIDVPLDPQDYAKTFVPKGAKEDET